jgi:hypothetical protein
MTELVRANCPLTDDQTSDSRFVLDCNMKPVSLVCHVTMTFVPERMIPSTGQLSRGWHKILGWQGLSNWIHHAWSFSCEFHFLFQIDLKCFLVLFLAGPGFVMSSKDHESPRYLLI